MKKLKVLFCLLLLTVVISLNIQVKAAEQLPDNAAIVSSSQVVQIKTGTGPFDDNDEPGNDSSEDNNIVRSFDQVTWTIENTLKLADSSAESYSGGVLYFKATLPESVKGDVKWVIDDMVWIENPVVSPDGLTLTGQYSLSTTDLTVPGKQNLVFISEVLSAGNGTTFKPDIRIWMNGNNESDYSLAEVENVVVSAAPRYNVRLVRNTNCNARVEKNLPEGNVWGRMYGYALVLQMRNDSTSKGLKGIEYPKGNITFDIDMQLTRSELGSSELEDITSEDNLILWNYKINNTSNNGVIPGRSMSIGINLGNHANYVAPVGIKQSDRRMSIYNSGNISMLREGNKLKVTISNYTTDGIFPDQNWGYTTVSTSVAYTKNIGCFGSYYFQLFVPDNEDTIVDDRNYYLTIADSNFSATSASGISTNEQAVTNDDTAGIAHVRYSPGSFSNHMYLFTHNGTTALHSHHTIGDNSGYRGFVFDSRVYTNLSQNNDADDKIYTHDKLFKFEADGLELAYPDSPNLYTISSYGRTMTYNVWYVTKQDGTNWTSETERNQTQIWDMKMYENYSDIPEGDVCVGLYFESISGYLQTQTTWDQIYFQIPMRIVDDAEIGRTYAMCQSTRLWRAELDRSEYSQTIKNGYADYPQTTMTREKDNYKRMVYDSNGAIVAGTHSGGSTYGQSILVVGARQSVSQMAIMENGNEKKNYDVSKNENVVTYKISPVIEKAGDINVISDITVTLTDTLPKGLTYVPGSSNYGEPDMTINSNGTTTLIWNITGCETGVIIEPLIFKASISEESVNGMQYENTVVMNADEKIGNTNITSRTSKYDIQIVNLASHRLYKTDITPVIEKDGTIHFVVSYKNNTDEVINNFQLLDILPYNEDGRGTNYTGNYTIDRIVLSQENSDGSVVINPELKLYYTNDSSARNANSKDSNLAEGWTEATSSNIMANGTAIVVKGKVLGQEKVNIDIYLKTNGNKGLDKYVNNATAQVYVGTDEMVTSNVTSQVVLRTIEGVAWKDANANGLKDANEEIYKDVAVTLTDANGAQVTDVDGHAVTTINTDENGYYKFTNLPMGNYLVKVAVTDDTYMLTEKEVGSNTTINSKFNVDSATTDEITKLNSIDLPELTQSNVNAGFVKKPTKVVVNYLEKGTTTKLLPEKTIDGRIDDEYSTTNRIAEVNAANGNKYNYDSVEGQVSGTMIEDTIYITYYYVKKDTNVKVLHVEEETDVSDPESVTDILYPTETINGKVDDEYNTSNRLTEINNTHTEQYDFVRSTTNTSGTMTVDTIYVIYEYKKAPAVVKVQHLEQGTNTELYGEETLNGIVGLDYTTANKLNEINSTNANKYELVTPEPSNKNGTYAREEQTVTYYYQKKMAEVEVNYVEVGTNTVLADQENMSDRIDEPYTTVNKLDEINQNYENKYEFVRVEGNVSGNYTLDKQVVTYYYQKKMAEVEVNYLEVGTNAILAAQENMSDRIDEPYTTVNKLDEINATFGNKYEFVRVDGNANGNYTLDKQVITYYYQKRQSRVVILHVDSETDITNPATITDVLYPTEEKTGRVDDLYNSVERTNEINASSNYKYALDHIIGNANGNFAVDTIYVIYVYAKQDTVLYIKHVDVVTGEELDSITVEGYIGDIVTTREGTFENYRLYEKPSTEEYTLTEEPITVTYYYIRQANVITKYVDEVTGNEISTQNFDTYDQNSEYTTEKKEIPEYTYTRDSENTSGTIGTEDITVTYYYKKNTSLLVRYIDYYTEEEISPSITMNGVEGQDYTTEQKEIDNYVYVDVIGTPAGQMAREPQEIIYRYKKQANLITEHIDANTGEKIIPDVTKKYMEKEEYEAYGQNIPGYVLVQEPESKTGVMGREDVTKTFYYKKISGGLIVKYVDVLTGELLDQEVYEGTEGEHIDFDKKHFLYYVLHSTPEVESANLTVEPQEYIYYYIRLGKVPVKGIVQGTGEVLYTYELSGIEGDTYQATPRNVEGYELVVIPDNERGTYQRNTREVVYEYRKIEEEKHGDVIVKYITEDGQELARETDNGLVGETFHFEEKTFEGYEVISRPDSLDGEYIEGTIELVFVLRPVEPTIVEGTIIVKFVDKNGNVLRQEVVSKDLVGEDYYLEAPEIDGYHVVGEDKVRATYVDGELVFEIVYDKDEEIIIDPEPHDDPAPTPTPEPEPQPEEPKTVDTSDMNMALVLVIAIASISGITLVKKYIKD